MTDQAIITQELPCDHHYKIGVITLNRPQSLNALSLTMVRSFYEQLQAWRQRPEIVCVLLQGAGDKAFCAGGDIQAMYHAMRQHPGQACREGEDFFMQEYRLDYTLHSYPKPVIAWGHGIIMGGGLGLFAGADFRIVTESAHIAMPEISIGLYPDVGAGYFLNRLPGHCGRFLGLTGAAVNAHDGLLLGLATEFIQQQHQHAVLAALRTQSWSDDNAANTQAIAALLRPFGEHSAQALPPGHLEAQRPQIDRLFGDTDIHRLSAQFLQLDSADPWLQKAQQTLAKGSPLSVLITDKMLRETQTLALVDVFKHDLVLACNILRFTEFTEGVRALLIDKDRQPNWHFKQLSDVPEDALNRFFQPPWESHPLAQLQ